MTQANNDSTQRRRAQFHLARATSYREDAVLLHDMHRKVDSGAALLYESAKQSVNAMANLDGQNPGAVGAKRAYLRRLSSRLPGSRFDLMRGWEAATQLHIRGHLAEGDFRDAWQAAQAFINDILAIYDTHRP